MRQHGVNVRIIEPRLFRAGSPPLAGIRLGKDERFVRRLKPRADARGYMLSPLRGWRGSAAISIFIFQRLPAIHRIEVRDVRISRDLPAGLVIVSNDTEAAIVSRKRQKNIPGFTPTNGNSDPLAGVNAVHDECGGKVFLERTIKLTRR